MQSWEMAGNAETPRERDRSRSPRRAPKDPAYWVDQVEQDWTRFQTAPDEIKATPQVVAEAMRHSDGKALRWASEELRADGEFLLGAAQEIGAVILGHAAEKLLTDREFMLSCAQELGAEVLAQASPLLRADRDFVLEVADYLPPTQVLSQAPPEVCSVLLSDREFVKEAVQQAGAEVLEGASETLRGDREFMLELSSYYGHAGGEVLDYATDELRAELFADYDFVLQCVRDMGVEVLEDASMELRNNREFIQEASTYCGPGEALEYASDEVRRALDQNYSGPSLSDQWEKQQPASEVPSSIGFQNDSESNRVAGTSLNDQWEAQQPASAVPASTAFPSSGQSVEVGGPSLSDEWEDHKITYAPPASKAIPQTAPHPLQLQTAHEPRADGATPKMPPPPPPPPGRSPPIAVEMEFESTAPPVMVDPYAGAAQTDPYAGVAPVQFQQLAPQPVQPLPPPAPQPVEPPPPAPKVDRQAILAALRMLGPQAIHNASAELRGDREFMLAAAGTPVEALTYASDELRRELSSDKEFMLKMAADINVGVFQYASSSLRSDREFVTKAAPSPGQALRYASQSLREALCGDREFMLKAIQEMGKSALQETSLELRGDREFIFAVTQKAAEATKFASPTLRKQLYADRAFMFRLVKEGGSKELCHASADLRSDREFILQAVSSSREALWFATQSLRRQLHADRDFMLRVVKEAGTAALKNISPELRADREFILQATSSAAEALKCASPSLRSQLYADRGFVSKAVQEMGKKVLLDASVLLREDKEFVFAFQPTAVEALEYAGPSLKATLLADKEFVTKAVREIGASALEQAAEQLLGDFAFMLSISAFCPEAMRFASSALKASLDADEDDE